MSGGILTGGIMSGYHQRTGGVWPEESIWPRGAFDRRLHSSQGAFDRGRGKWPGISDWEGVWPGEGIWPGFYLRTLYRGSHSAAELLVLFMYQEHKFVQNNEITVDLRNFAKTATEVERPKVCFNTYR